MAGNTRINGSSVEQVRVYAPSNGSLAYRQDYAYRSAQLAPQTKPRPETKPEQRRKQKQHISLLQMARQNRFALKFLAILCIAAVAGVAAFAVVRFAKIADIQSEINALNERIADTERSIENLSFNTQPVLNATEFAEAVGLVPARP